MIGEHQAEHGAGTLEPKFPLEFVVRGTPVSLQGSPRARDEWKERVRDASRTVLPEGHWATEGPISLTVFYFPEDRMQGQSALMKAFEGESADWEFRVIYAKPGSGAALLNTVPPPLISSQLNSALALAEQGQLQAALLLGWAILEASARTVAPNKLSHPQPPSRLIEALASVGDVTPSEADTLRRLATARNRLAHGMLDEPVDHQDLSKLLVLLASMMSKHSGQP